VPSPDLAYPFLRPVSYPLPLPQGQPHLSTTDRNALMRVSPDLLTCSAPDGWRSIRGSTPVREGSVYFEFEVEVAGSAASAEEASTLASASHAPGFASLGGGGVAPAVRLGVGRREATLGWPVGGDGYSYGFRDRGGERIWLGKVKEYDSRTEGPRGFRSGDVVGCWINIPPAEVPSASARSTADVDMDAPAAAPSSSTGEASSSLGKRWEFDARSQPYLAGVPPPPRPPTSPPPSAPSADDSMTAPTPSAPAELAPLPIGPTPAFDPTALHPDRRIRIPIRYKNQLYFESRAPQVSKEMEVLMDPPAVPASAAAPAGADGDGEPVVLRKKGKNRITNKTLPSSDEMLRASLTTPLRPLPTLRGSSLTFFVNGVPLGPAFEDLLDWRPLAVVEEEVKKGRRKKASAQTADVDDGTLGYYPMISCFGGGRVKFNPGPNFRFPLPSLVPDSNGSMSSSSPDAEPALSDPATTSSDGPPPCASLTATHARHTAFQRSMDELAEELLAVRWVREAAEEAERARLKAEADEERRVRRLEAERARTAAKRAAKEEADARREAGLAPKIESSPAPSAAVSVEASPSPVSASLPSDPGLPHASQSPSADAAPLLSGKKRSRSASTGPAKPKGAAAAKGATKKTLPKSKLGGVSIKPDPDAQAVDDVAQGADSVDGRPSSAGQPNFPLAHPHPPHVMQEASASSSASASPQPVDLHHFAYPPPASTPFIPQPQVDPWGGQHPAFSAFPAPSYAARPMQHQQPYFDGRLPPFSQQTHDPSYAHFSQYPPPPPQHSFDPPSHEPIPQQLEIDPSLMDEGDETPVAGVPDGVELGDDDAEGELEDEGDVDMQ